MITPAGGQVVEQSPVWLISSIIAVNQTDTFRPGPEGKTGPTVNQLTVNNPNLNTIYAEISYL